MEANIKTEQFNQIVKAWQRLCDYCAETYAGKITEPITVLFSSGAYLGNSLTVTESGKVIIENERHNKFYRDCYAWSSQSKLDQYKVGH